MRKYDPDGTLERSLRERLRDNNRLIGEARYRGEVGEITVRCYHISSRRSVVTSIQAEGQNEVEWDYDPLPRSETTEHFWNDISRRLSPIYFNYQSAVTDRNIFLGFRLVPGPRDKRDID
jgi:hypothetical protein